MTIKYYLKNIQKLIPNVWLESLQFIHAWLIWKLLISIGSQPLPSNKKSAMIFSPHQDDETFGCGGMIAVKRQQGIPVNVVFVTDGKGVINSNPDWQNQIIQTRQQEAITALNILGVDVDNIHFLSKPDGLLLELNDEERRQTIEEIVSLIKYYQPQEIYVPHRKDCHKDHEATYELVKMAIYEGNFSGEMLQYPVWIFWRSPLFILLKFQDLAAAYKFSIASVQEQKHRAIAAYHSQLESLPKGFIKQFLSYYEIFFKVHL